MAHVPLREGQRIAIDPANRTSGFGSPVAGDIPQSSRVWFEERQTPAMREVGSGYGPPTLPEKVIIYEVHGGDLDAAQSAALANPQFGVGGGAKVFVADVEDALVSGRLVKVGEHHFDPETTGAGFEDPRFRQVDPTLPESPLDPEGELLLGQMEKAREEAGRGVGGAVGSGMYDRAEGVEEMSKTRAKDQYSEGAR